MIRTLIVDDEPLARDRMRRLLSEERDIELLASCGSGPAALAAIRTYAPDLVFLDIQMPGMSGLDVVEELGDGEFPYIIFVTAHDTYALKAFDVHALDYLLKPYDRERFRRAVAHARSMLLGHGSERVLDRIKALGERFHVVTGGRVTVVPARDVDWIESAGNYLVLHEGGRKHLLRSTMHEVEERLGPPFFLRVHRSAMVRLAAVREFRPTGSGAYVLELRNGVQVAASRSHRKSIREHLSSHRRASSSQER